MPQPPEWLDLISEMSGFLAIPFLFTCIISPLAMRSLHWNYRRFIRARQLFSLELVHSIAALTVMVSNLPSHRERSLAVYFENMNLPVERQPRARDRPSAGPHRQRERRPGAGESGDTLRREPTRTFSDDSNTQRLILGHTSILPICIRFAIIYVLRPVSNHAS